jgi:hypothetical protein
MMGQGMGAGMGMGMGAGMGGMGMGMGGVSMGMGGMAQAQAQAQQQYQQMMMARGKGGAFGMSMGMGMGMGKGVMGKGSWHPGDWVCMKCSNNNFARRSSCNKCGVSKEFGSVAPSVGGPTQQSRGPGLDKRPGDWECPQCANNNFARRSTCNKCDCARPGEGDGSAVANGAGDAVTNGEGDAVTNGEGVQSKPAIRNQEQVKEAMLKEAEAVAAKKCEAIGFGGSSWTSSPPGLGNEHTASPVPSKRPRLGSS